MSTALIGRAGTPVALGFIFSAGAEAVDMVGQIAVVLVTLLTARTLCLRLRGADVRIDR
jgi:hypothetical protein